MKRFFTRLAVCAAIVSSYILGYGYGLKDTIRRLPVIIPIEVQQAPIAYVEYEQFSQLTPEQQCADGGPSAAQILYWVDKEVKDNDWITESMKKQLVLERIRKYDIICKLTYRLKSAKDVIEPAEGTK